MPCVCLSLSLLSFPGIFGEFPFLVLDRPPLCFLAIYGSHPGWELTFLRHSKPHPVGTMRESWNFCQGTPKGGKILKKIPQKGTIMGDF